MLMPKADVGLEQNLLCGCLRCELNRPLFLQNIIFTWKDNWQTNHGYSDLGTWQTFSQKWTEWACHFKENSWQCLLLKIKCELSSDNRNFGKLVSATAGLIASQYLKAFSACPLIPYDPLGLSSPSSRKSSCQGCQLPAWLPRAVCILGLCPPSCRRALVCMVGASLKVCLVPLESQGETQKVRTPNVNISTPFSSHFSHSHWTGSSNFCLHISWEGVTAPYWAPALTSSEFQTAHLHCLPDSCAQRHHAHPVAKLSSLPTPYTCPSSRAT